MTTKDRTMTNKRFLLLSIILLFHLYYNAFAGDMRITLQNNNCNIVFYDGDIINGIASKIDSAPEITVEDIFLCPQAEEGTYCLVIKKDGKSRTYTISDNFQVYTKNPDGYPVALSCKILNELRGVLIRYLISNYLDKSMSLSK